MTVTLATPLSTLIGNKRRVGALKALGVATCGDALTYYPFRLAPATPLTPLSQVRIGEPAAFPATVRNVRVSPMSGRGSRIEVTVDDADYIMNRTLRPGRAMLTFFTYKSGYVDWMMGRVQIGTRMVVKGTPSVYNERLQFTHPELLVAGRDCRDVADGVAKVRLPRPVYHATSRITTDRIHEAIIGVLDAFEGRVPAAAARAGAAPGSGAPGVSSVVEPVVGVATLPGVPDIVPEPIRVAEGLMHRAESFEAIHRPSDKERFDMALRTMRFEEALVSQVALLHARADAQREEAFACPAPAPVSDGAASGGAASTSAHGSAAPSAVARFIDSLPFELTAGQRRVIDTIDADMARDVPMQRLLQGEVGSGKTVVALAAMLRAVDAGHQAVLVAPTQVLAEQHMESVSAMLRRAGLLDEDWQERYGGKTRRSRGAAAADDADASASKALHGDSAARSAEGGPRVPVVLLTGGMRLAQRRRVLALAASGDPCIVIATHAAFSKTFQAPRMALAVIDEQHRFGVEQRDVLRRKSEKAPHLLVMTATPIPRTAAMTWFGDLDISELTELPGGRKPIRTFVVPEGDGATMSSMFEHLRKRIDAGERVFVVCPAIDTPDADTGDSDDGAEMGADAVTPDGAGHGRRGGARRGSVYDDATDLTDGADLFDVSGLSGADGGGAGEGPDGEGRTLHSVREIAERLSRLPQLAGVGIATLTGRDKEDAKRETMERFISGETPLLVATTVIEVGVDVPQASCIVIFDADCFGLSQLHQLRGRVGRGGTDAWCFLVSRAEEESLGDKRLTVIRDSTDGARIAEADLELRGAGDVLGDSQSGKHSSFKLLRVVGDKELIASARGHAQALLEGNPTLAGEPQLAGAALDFMRGNEEYLNRS